jgi:hypothetical protein
VDAAKEIIYVFSQEHAKKHGEDEAKGRLTSEGESNGALQKSTLGADDFLPIFIYSVVRADMERPCALCKPLVSRFSSPVDSFFLTVSFLVP